VNSLNSVLIEGNLVSDPITTDMESGNKFCTFSVESKRYYNHDNERKVEVSLFSVGVWNRTAELCQKTLSAGRGVRVVGRLKEVKGFVSIVGESVEFKAKFDKKPEDVASEGQD